jgi:DNA repair photolyase
MRRFTGHKEKWCEFVDIKVNAPELLAREIKRKRMGRVWVSGVCDPYQAIRVPLLALQKNIQFIYRYQISVLSIVHQISVLSIVPPTRRQNFTAKRWPS